MKIYLASKYCRHELNNNIKAVVEKASGDFEILLPESLRLEEKTEEQRREVKEKCCRMIRESDAVLAVEPFGRDVAFEIGYAQALKDLGKNIKILRIGAAPKIGAMVDPCFSYDYTASVTEEATDRDLSELLKYLDRLKR